MRIERAFADLILRLKAIYRGEVFELLPTVQPVTIVDTDINLSSAIVGPLMDGAFTEGLLVAPADALLMADTGPLPAGNYAIRLLYDTNDNAGAARVRLQRRDAANTGNIWDHILNVETPGHRDMTFHVTLGVNERFRAIKYGAGTATLTYQISLWATLA